MSDIFISHVEEDFGIVEELAHGLEAHGFSTWYYERDSAAGASYLVQTREAIVDTQAVVLVVSRDSLSSHQVSKEVVRAHEAHKPIIPLLSGVTDVGYKRRQPEWEEAIGAATSLAIPEAGAGAILPRVLRGLDKLGVRPSGQPGASTSAASQRPIPARETSQGQATDVRRFVPARVVVAGAIAAFTLIAGFVNCSNAINPAPGGDAAKLYGGFPAVRTANVLANGVNASLSVVVLFGCWLVYQARRQGSRIVRNAAAAMVAVSAVWFLWVLAGTLLGANWAYVSASDRSTLLTAITTAGMIGVLLTGTVFVLFRKPE